MHSHKYGLWAEPYLWQSGKCPYTQRFHGHLLRYRSSAVLTNFIGPALTAVAGPKELQEISQNLSSIQNLGPAQQEAVRNAFAVGYNKQMQLLTGFSGAALLVSLLIWEWKARVVK